MYSKHARVGNGAENMSACNDQRERLWGIPLTGSGNSLSWKCRSNRALTSGFQFVETALNPNRSLDRLPIILGCFHRFLFIFRLLVGILPVLFS